jgi:hypothetical protein
VALNAIVGQDNVSPHSIASEKQDMGKFNFDMRKMEATKDKPINS